METNWPFIFALAGIFLVAAVALFVIANLDKRRAEAEDGERNWREMCESASDGRSAAWRERDEARAEAAQMASKWRTAEAAYLDADKRVKELEAELSAALTTTEEWIARYSEMQGLYDRAVTESDGLWCRIDRTVRDLSAVLEATRKRGEGVIGEDGR